MRTPAPGKHTAQAGVVKGFYVSCGPSKTWGPDGKPIR